MHIPDGFLSTPVWLSLDAVGVPAVAFAARRAQREIDETRVPLLGVMGAFVFAAQMINFPVGAGTSAHLVGGTLLAITLGPSAAVVAMTAILAIQAFVFQDGGVLALGANLFNMAFVGVAVGYLPYHFLERRRLAFFLGGALSVMVSALFALAELLLSGRAIPSSVLPFFFGVFAVNAVAEGLITASVMEGIGKLNPGFIRQPVAIRPRALAAIALASTALAGAGFLFADTHPDGVERLASWLGIAGFARTLFHSPLADYRTVLFGSASIGKAAAGLAGLALIYAVCRIFGRYISRQRSA